MADKKDELIIDSLYENQAGHPFHEWVVTIGDSVEGWWGEGYVIHTVEPTFIAKWGFTTKLENSALSCGMRLDDDRYLSCFMMNTKNVKDEKLDGLIFQMPMVVFQYLDSINETEEGGE